jgi:sec-independent protein translocase protein TatA
MTSLPLAFLGVDEGEMLLIMVAILIFFGGNRMPEFARGLGKAIRELRKATGEVEREFKRVMDEAEHAHEPTTFPKAGSPASVPRTESLPATQSITPPHPITGPQSAASTPSSLPSFPEATAPSGILNPASDQASKDKPAHLPDIELPPAPQVHGEHDYHSDI